MADHNLTPINYKSISEYHKIEQKFEEYNAQKGSKGSKCPHPIDIPQESCYNKAKIGEV